MSKFKILWIDDQTKKCEKDKGSIVKIIKHFGFEPEVVFESDISEDSLRNPEGNLNKQITARDVDLFLVDYNLKNDIFGSDIVREIRIENNIYTDIIFYSSDAKMLINAIQKSFEAISIMDFCDGVYVAPLGDEFNSKVAWVIQKIIKSWYNVHSIRGIVLSKSSKFEQMIGKIIAANYKWCLSGIKEILSKKGDNVINNTKEKWSKVMNSDDPIPSILKDPINFNWTVKRIILQELVDSKQVPLTVFDEIKKLFDLRNDFAHNPMHLEEGKLVLDKNGELKYFTEKDVEVIREILAKIEKELLAVIGTDNESDMAKKEFLVSVTSLSEITEEKLVP